MHMLISCSDRRFRHTTPTPDRFLDGAVSAAYKNDGLNYRPRYTPIMRALIKYDSVGVTQIAQTAGITQPAATQTISLMIRDGLLFAEPNTVDNRQSLIRMTPYGIELLPHLEACWCATTAAADSLDDDLPFPQSRLLELAIEALSDNPFGARIEAGRQTKLTKHLTKNTSLAKVLVRANDEHQGKMQCVWDQYFVSPA